MNATVTVDQGGLRPWHVFLLVSLVAATVAVWTSADRRPESLAMVVFTALAVCGVGAAAFRTLYPFAEDQRSDPESQALSGRAREALEREKMMVLRSIKELEFDRAMGKIADSDFADMSGRLRARAAGLMQQLDADAGGYRAAIERDLRALVQRHPVAPVAPAPAAVSSAVPSAGSTPAAVASVTCASCATPNDPDARFCKRCGSPLAS